MADSNQKPSDPGEPLLFRLDASAGGPHPYSPAGGGGRGGFTCAAPAGSAPLMSDYYHPAGVIAWQEQGGQPGWWDQLEELQNALSREWGKTTAELRIMGQKTAQVFEALGLAFNRDRVLAALGEETGLIVSGLPAAVIAGLEDCIYTLVKFTLGGAAVGAILTIPAGGAGAAPGAELGFGVGLLYIQVKGLYEITKHVLANLGEVLVHISAGVELAWNAGLYGRPKREGIEAAAQRFDKAIGVLFRLLLEGIVIVILLRGIRTTVAALGESQLGKEFAAWVEQNQKAMLNNPKLRPKGMTAGAGAEAPKVEPPAAGKGKAGEAKPKPKPAPVPRGFKSKEQYEQCMNELDDALRKSGVSDARTGVRGSAVSGVSSKGGPFRDAAQGGKPPSDVDVFIESGQLTKGINPSKNIPGFVHPAKVMQRYPELAKWSKKWSGQLGREITPGAFKPGTVPEGPKIFFGGK